MIIRIEQDELEKAVKRYVEKKYNMELKDKAEIEFSCNHEKLPRRYFVRVYPLGKDSEKGGLNPNGK